MWCVCECGWSDCVWCFECVWYGFIFWECEGEGDVCVKVVCVGCVVCGEMVLDDCDVWIGELIVGKGVGGGDVNV